MQPVAPRERLATLDVLRGFALFGVLVGNTLELYSGRWFSEAPPPTGVDAAARWFHLLFVQSRAQTLLTLLFGLGFAMQLLRARERGERVAPLYIRRMLTLLALGWCHVLLLSFVDVTWGYAIAGFALLPFREVSNRTRVIWGAAMILLPSALYGIPDVFPAIANYLFGAKTFARYSQGVLDAMHGHDRIAMAAAHALLAFWWTFASAVWYLPWLVGHFLIGYVAGIQRWFDRDGADHVAMFRKLLWIGLPITVAWLGWTVLARSGGLRGYEILMPGQLALGACEQIGVMAQVGVYVACVVLLMQRPGWRRILVILAPVGRMPLTTYFMQSLSCTMLFYAWGFGWSMPNYLETLEICAVIFVVQIAIAHVWLRYFRFGPLEWVWRACVYWKRPAMRIRV